MAFFKLLVTKSRPAAIHLNSLGVQSYEPSEECSLRLPGGRTGAAETNKGLEECLRSKRIRLDNTGCEQERLRFQRRAHNEPDKRSLRIQEAAIS